MRPFASSSWGLHEILSHRPFNCREWRPDGAYDFMWDRVPRVALRCTLGYRMTPVPGYGYYTPTYGYAPYGSFGSYSGYGGFNSYGAYGGLNRSGWGWGGAF